MNINEYDIHENPDSLDPIIDKIAHIIQTYRNVDSIKKRQTLLSHLGRRTRIKNGSKYMFNSVLGCQYVINVKITIIL